MSQAMSIIEQYYNGFKNNGQIDPELFASDFIFKGPLMQCDNLDKFLAKAQQFFNGITGIDIRARFSHENQVCIFADLHSITPFNGITRYAELFTLQDNKIKAIELIYDAREWAKVINVDVHSDFE